MEVASGVATNVLSRLASYATQEVCLAWGAQLELKKLNKTMSTIKLVVEDAEEKQVNNPRITLWLGNLKDVCNDAEDVLDDFDFQKLQQQMLINKSRSSRVKAKVHQIFSRWNPVVFNFKMGHKLKEIRVRLDEIDREKSRFALDRAVEASRVPPRVQDRERMTDSVMEPLSVIGRDGDKEKIIKLLLSDSTDHSSDDENLSIISIVGLGGLGKTTLAKLVYNAVEGDFEKKMWVCVSENFDIQTLVESIIKAATEQKCECLSLDLMKRDLQRKLRDKKFLLVLDDVWDIDSNGVTLEKWIELKKLLHVGAHGSKIVVTTRNQSVSSLIDPVYMHTLRSLYNKDGMSLFMSRAFTRENEQKYPHLIPIGEEIVNKCGGVPLALVALGGMLHSKRERRDWLRVRDRMWNYGENDKTMEALKLSYDALPPHLKLCFAFCSLFPKDYPFYNIDIVLLWNVHGYLTSSSREEKDSQEIGLDCIREFCSRSFFEIVEDHKTHVWFKIHDLIHDLAISVAGAECSTINGRSPTDAFEKVRHLSTSSKHMSEVGSQVPEVMLRSEKLRTILFPTHREGGGITDPSFVKTCIMRFKFMRVLDLGGSTLEEIPTSIGNLSHLRYLNMRWSKRLKRLPNSICKLLKLEHLDFGFCEALEEIPKDIGNLINLVLLGISTQQMYLPKGTFKGLSLLRALGIQDCINLKLLGEEFKYLLNLRQLVIERSPNMESLPPSLKNLSAFDTLWMNRCEKLELTKSGQGIRGHRSFTIITSSLEALPDWLHESADTLQSITMSNCYNLTTLPEWLEDLKLLEGLTITDCTKLSALPPGLHRLTALRELTIRNCPELSKGCKRQFKGEEWARFVHDTKIKLLDDASDEEEDEASDVSNEEEDEGDVSDEEEDEASDVSDEEEDEGDVSDEEEDEGADQIINEN